MYWFTVDFWHDTGLRFLSWALGAVPGIFLILLLALVVSRFLDRVMASSSRFMTASITRDRSLDDGEVQKRLKTLTGILTAGTRILLWLVVGMMILRRLGIDVAPLMAGAGVLGLALGFGAQELVRDFIAGFFILMENQIRLGDVVSINGTGGLVEHVGFRTVVLRDNTGTVHVFQNGKINTVSNMTKDWSAQVFDIGVAYKEDTDRVVAVMRSVAADLRQDQLLGPDILEDLEVMGVDSFADSAVVIKARIKTRPIRQWAVGREYRRRLKYAFDREGIEIPFPHRTIFWGQDQSASLPASPPEETGASDGGGPQ
ncbi:mechanosensitive ion channel protein MscS [Alkalispirochaeta sphaeroplastigenens]|uniref:Mechanosensitive ion channel protein MscS n=1 Tax=Alkalispirochaeta sphaeroplastigenens TaxID=1187066 RepID=A0A2S4K1I9_9SPIO|nr:mechanosensitive ion channel family protein [Alkalispirochaeta sphaeroplastigenens]POR05633.1 mechanosensitive ion channel protein MscS [Alkalispirochaeta sphaeroplastigenens]